MSNRSRYDRRRTHGWQILGILIVVGYVIVQFVIFQVSLSRLPASWTIGGQTFPNQTFDEAMTQLDTDLQQPVVVHYLTSTVQLDPTVIDFTFDMTETKRLAQDARTRSSSLSDFLRHLILQPPAARDIPVVASYSDEKARAFLADVATRFDVPPRPPAPQLDQLTLTSGQAGRLLNIADSMPPLEDAVKSAQKRAADLVVDERAAPPPTIDQLKELLQARLAKFEGTASVFVKDLRTGEELHINPNVPFSGGGVMKLPIVAEVYRKYDLPLDVTTTQRLTATLTTELSNLPANQLLNQIGEGNTFVGANTTTASLAHLGLRNSYLAQPFDQPITATAGLSTPANSTATINTNASPANQTTASDMGLLWEMIDQCSRGGGALLVVYPNEYSPLECREMIERLQTNT
ncbi:MAG TPA: serine hydrolase, partial [Anaerolineae bacterium]|nr:serine hydrolase [Anaerolineae bacterium]